jgi:hypothetical protein
MVYSEVLTGTVDITGTILYTAPAGGATISALRFSNPAAYDITISRFDNIDGTTLDLYSLSLAAGDIVSDTYNYTLKDGDYIMLTSSVVGTVYSCIVGYIA